MIYTLITPEALGTFLVFFKDLFTAPSYRYFCSFIMSLMVLDTKRCVTNIILTSRIGKHWTNFYRFLREYKWSPQQVSQRLLELLIWNLKPERDNDGRIRIYGVVDDTHAIKCGKKIYGVSWFSRKLKNMTKKIFGNCFVCFGLLFQINKRWILFPIAALVYIRKKYIEELPEKEQAKEENKFMTKIELAIKIITGLTFFEWIHLIIITDGAYAQMKSFAFPLLKKGIDVLGRLRKDAVCFSLLTPREKEGRGRPRIYGQRLNLEEMASDKSLFQPYKLFLYGKEVITEIASKIIILKGWNRPILLVMAKEKNGQPIFLFTTDLSLTPARVVELYAPRWKIEISFRELKQEGGMADYQVRSKKGIERHVTLCFVAHCLLQLLSILDVKERLSIDPIFRPWYKSPLFSISQTRLMIQQVCIRNLFFQLLGKMGIPYEKYKVISAFNELINGQYRDLGNYSSNKLEFKLVQKC